VDVRAIGAGAVNQATKAATIARGYLELDGIDIVIVPSFTGRMSSECLANCWTSVPLWGGCGARADTPFAGSRPQQDAIRACLQYTTLHGFVAL
jgi:hypothetical protein